MNLLRTTLIVGFLFSVSELRASITVRYSQDGGAEQKFEFPHPNGDMTVVVNGKGTAGWSEFGLRWIDFRPDSAMIRALSNYLVVRKQFAPDIKNEEVTINLELGRAINPYSYELKSADAANAKFTLDGLDVGGDFSKAELAKYVEKRSASPLARQSIESRKDLSPMYFAEISHQFAAALGRHLAQHYLPLGEPEDIDKLAKEYFSFDVEFGKTYLQSVRDNLTSAIRAQFVEFMGVFMMDRYSPQDRMNNRAVIAYYATLFPCYETVARVNDRDHPMQLSPFVKELMSRAQAPLDLVLQNLTHGKLLGTFEYVELRNAYASKDLNNPANRQEMERSKLRLLASINNEKIQTELGQAFIFGFSKTSYECKGPFFRSIYTQR